MAIIHNRIDLALVSTGPTEVVDCGETGGIPNAQIVVELTGGGSVTIEGSDKEDGSFTTVETITVPESGVYRMRFPLDCPKYLRLAAASGATLSIRA